MLVLGSVLVSALVASAVAPVQPVMTLDQMFPHHGEIIVGTIETSEPTIEVQPMTIVARVQKVLKAPMVRAATPCEFGSRGLTQGPDTMTVRGFCGG